MMMMMMMMMPKMMIFEKCCMENNIYVMIFFSCLFYARTHIPGGVGSVTKSLSLQVGLYRKVPAINSLGRNDFE